MSFVIVTSERFADHLTPVGHPERPERAEVMQAVAMRFSERAGTILEPREATDEDLARVLCSPRSITCSTDRHGHGRW